MRRKKIGIMDFHGSVDITDPCYDRDIMCRMNDVQIANGEYSCYIWRSTESYECDGKTITYHPVGAIGIYKDGEIPRQKDMEQIGGIGVDAGLAGFFHNKPDYGDNEWKEFCERIEGENHTGWITEDGFYSSTGFGDGYYPVYAYYTNNLITALEIRFL